ncbi:MAG: tetratricopeptide repeat protein [Phycisphaerae bacterium]|nr:tetratricopeptide repeat protein [Phycisphaerae bacterium]
MLGELSGQEESLIRRRLAELARWQMVEFKGTAAELHTLVRKFLTERIGEERTKGMRLQIARWWAERDVPARPVSIDEIRPLLKAVEHLIAAGEPEGAAGILYSKWSEESHYSLSEWLRVFGYLEEGVRIIGTIIRVYVNLVEKENRRELRNALAGCYNNRGNAYRAQGRLSEAIADYGKAIEIYKELVEKENRRELRNDLASCYNNRGNAYRAQGRLSEAIADYGKAIEIREELVEKENRRELRNELESSLFNRASAYSEEKKWEKARTDIEKGAGLLRGLIKEGQRHVIGSFLQTAGFRCKFAKVLGEVKEASEWANEGMRWFMEEVEGKRDNEVLLKAAAGFAQVVKGNMELLLKNGLDEKLFERMLKELEEER